MFWVSGTNIYKTAEKIIILILKKIDWKYNEQNGIK